MNDRSLDARTQQRLEALERENAELRTRLDRLGEPDRAGPSSGTASDATIIEYQSQLERLGAERDAAESYARKLQLLNEFSEHLTLAASEAEILQIAAGYVPAILRADRTAIALTDDSAREAESFRLVGLESERGVQETGAEIPFHGSLAGRAIASKSVVRIVHLEAAGDYQESALLHKNEISSALVAPMMLGKRVLGALYAGAVEADAYEDRDEDTLLAVASFLCISIENMRRATELDRARANLEERTRQLDQNLQQLHRDLETARGVQQKLLPRPDTRIPGVDLAYAYVPLDRVGGDIVDIAELRPGVIRMFLADAIGHGVQASLVTIAIKSEYEELKRSVDEPALVLKELNRLMFTKYSQLQTFFPCIVLDLDLNRGKLRYSSAGHCAQLLLTERGLRELPRTSRLIGILEEFTPENRELSAQSGDLLFLFSDGVLETVDQSFEEFGEARLQANLADLYAPLEDGSRRSMQDLVQSMLKRVNAFARGAPGVDDITLAAVRLY